MVYERELSISTKVHRRFSVSGNKSHRLSAFAKDDDIWAAYALYSSLHASLSLFRSSMVVNRSSRSTSPQRLLFFALWERSSFDAAYQSPLAAVEKEDYLFADELRCGFASPSSSFQVNYHSVSDFASLGNRLYRQHKNNEMGRRIDFHIGWSRPAGLLPATHSSSSTKRITHSRGPCYARSVRRLQVRESFSCWRESAFDLRTFVAATSAADINSDLQVAIDLSILRKVDFPRRSRIDAASNPTGGSHRGGL